MRRVAVVAPQIVVAVLAGLTIGLLWLAGEDEPGSGPPPDELVTATASFTPSAHTFGAPVVANVDVVVDNRSVDADSIRADVDLAPYEVVGTETVERTDAGATSRIRFTYPLRCLGEGCDPTGAAGTIQLPTGRVLYRFAGRQGDAVEALDWPPVTVTGGVSGSDATEIRWRASETAVAEPTFRVDPVRTAGALLAVALGLAGLAAWLAWRLWRPRSAAGEDDEPEVMVLSPLARALDSARLASRNGDVGTRRRALERVSRELTAVGLHQLAADASILAWAAPGSSEADVDDLAQRSEAELDGGDAR